MRANLAPGSLLVKPIEPEQCRLLVMATSRNRITADERRRRPYEIEEIKPNPRRHLTSNRIGTNVIGMTTYEITIDSSTIADADVFTLHGATEPDVFDTIADIVSDFPVVLDGFDIDGSEILGFIGDDVHVIGTVTRTN